MRIIVLSCSISRRRVLGSSPEVGSSITSMSSDMESTDAMATGLFPPPESLYGGLSFAFRSDSQPNLRLPMRQGFLQPP